MNFSTLELIGLPFVLAIFLLFPFFIIRIFYGLPVWLKVRDLKRMAKEQHLEYVHSIKTVFFDFVGIISLMYGSHNGKKLYAFSIVPYKRTGRRRYTWINGAFHKTLKASEFDLAINDSSYKQIEPKGVKFENYIIPVGVTTSEFIVMFSGIVYLKSGMLIPFEIAKELWSAGRRYYASKASFKQKYFTKDGSEKDVILIYNNEEAYAFYKTKFKKEVDFEMMKIFFDTYQNFINQTGKTVPVNFNSTIGGF
ncbi:MAG: hypothetical protein ACD_15C00237G0008 [uncultured bacterium]|nr:MAG: hypothetical protein ACD_15C00237G0008 [uncultured bacterium]